MFYEYGVAVAATIGTLMVAALVVRGRHRGEPLPHGGHFAAWMVGFAFLVAGAAVFIATSVATQEDLAPGVGGPFVSAFLVAVGILAIGHPAHTSRILIWSGLAAIAVMASLTLLTFFFDKAEWRYSEVAPLVVTAMFFTIPALVSGLLFLGAAQPPRGRSAAASAAQSV